MGRSETRRTDQKNRRRPNPGARVSLHHRAHKGCMPLRCSLLCKPAMKHRKGVSENRHDEGTLRCLEECNLWERMCQCHLNGRGAAWNVQSLGFPCPATTPTRIRNREIAARPLPPVPATARSKCIGVPSLWIGSTSAHRSPRQSARGSTAPRW